jgi:DNA mismatch repair protein MutS
MDKSLNKEFSPMMRQYFEIKENNPDTILFFRLGDFYEMFFEDAKTASKELELVLTGRECGREERAPMCGVPFHSADGYIARLISRGYKVAVCEQVEDPAAAKGIVKRDVVRIVTPGTVIESNMLDEGRNNFLASVYLSDEGGGVCFVDISTGTVHLGSFTGDNANDFIVNELGSYSPREVLLNQYAADETVISSFFKERTDINKEVLQDELFDTDKNTKTIKAYIKEDMPNLPNVLKDNILVFVFAAALNYLSEVQKGAVEGISEIKLISTNALISLDLASRRNLELTETMIRREKRGSLLWVLDKTKTAMGKRRLRSWVEQPLYSCAHIILRQNAVEELFENMALLEDITEQLEKTYDLERIMARIVYGSANPKELIALKLTIERLADIKELLKGARTRMLKGINTDIDLLLDVHTLISASIDDEPPLSVRDGGFVKNGYNAELDELRGIVKDSKNFILSVEAREQEKTGIKKLKIGYNRVFGYYIEVLNTYRDMTPNSYIRKQTLTNCERYITDELKELESKILGAQERIIRIEAEIFSAVLSAIAEELGRVRTTARAIAALDALSSFARVSRDNNYVKPVVDDSDEIIIKSGRHPVIELMLGEELFVPNDAHLNCKDLRTAIITGPNMAGKSTYMRQVAIITLMAQIGCFVPARSAKIGVVSKIFTRVGASDDLSAGQSTFMIEMTEVASILKNADPRSLIIFDEIGRGTSTYDGMSIAKAVLEYTNNSKFIGAKTLFATHYHELSDLEATLSGVNNYNICVKRHKGEITFLRRIEKGAADGSYGIDVAALAGVPKSVVKRAKEVLKELEAAHSLPKTTIFYENEDMDEDEELQISFQSNEQKEIYEELQTIDINTLTPFEALSKLNRLINKAKGEK